MKKHLFLLLLPFTILTSCGSNYDGELQKQTFYDAVENFEASTYTSYSVVGEGHALTGNPETNGIMAIECDPSSTIKTDRPIVKIADLTGLEGAALERAINRGTQTSLFLKIPMFIADSTNVEYIYNRITAILNSSIDSKATGLTVEQLDDGQLHVFNKKVQKKELSFYNITNSYDAYRCSARYEIDLVYSTYGLLLSEKVKSINPLSSSKDITVDLSATYSYN